MGGYRGKKGKKRKKGKKIENGKNYNSEKELLEKELEKEKQNHPDHGDSVGGSQLPDFDIHDEPESGEDQFLDDPVDESTLEPADEDQIEIFDDEFDEDAIRLPGEPDFVFAEPKEPEEAEPIEAPEPEEAEPIEAPEPEEAEPIEAPESEEAEPIEVPEPEEAEPIEVPDELYQEEIAPAENKNEVSRDLDDKKPEDANGSDDADDEREDVDEEADDDVEDDDEDFLEADDTPKNKRKKRKEEKRKEKQEKKKKAKEKNKEEDLDLEQDKKKTSIGKKILITLGCILGALILVYGGFAVYFYSHFYFFTEINGVDFSGKSVSDVEKYMSGQVDDYVLTMDENNGTQETIKGSDIALSYKKGTDLEKALHRQNPLLWVEPFWKEEKLSVDVGVTYDNNALKNLIDSLKCSDQSTWTESVNAVPEYNGSQYTVKEEVYGTKMDMERAYAAIGDAISQFRPELNMEETGCYSDPKFTKDSPEVQAACDTMNGYIKTSITYDMSPNTEVVDANTITQWLSVNQEDMSVILNQDAVGEYIANLADKYDTVGKSRTFTTATGNQATVEGGTYGWQIDQDAEKGALIASIQAGEVATRQPAYAQTGATHDAADWGNTYAEVDLTNQHMWYVQGGSVVFEADVVTGLPTPQKETPAGAWSCLEKMQNKTLRGDRQSDGSYEYETPVAYWMRVTWSGVGFHTATWQPYFGGSRYQTNGSHGCINMSYSDSQTLYGIIQVGDPIIVHY